MDEFKRFELTLLMERDMNARGNESFVTAAEKSDAQITSPYIMPSTPFMVRKSSTKSSTTAKRANIQQTTPFMWDNNSMDLEATSTNVPKNSSSILHGKPANGFGHEAKPTNGVEGMSNGFSHGNDVFNHKLSNGFDHQTEPTNGIEGMSNGFSHGNCKTTNGQVNEWLLNGKSTNGFDMTTNDIDHEIAGN